MKATAPTTRKKADLVFELYVDSEGKKAAIKKALRARKMVGRLKSFTTTGSTLQVKEPVKMTMDAQFLSNTYVTSNPLEHRLEMPSKEH